MKDAGRLTRHFLWRMKHVASSVTHIPAAPGLYVVGHEESLVGLELKRVYVYVGKTLSMRRRLLDRFIVILRLRSELPRQERTATRQNHLVGIARVFGAKTHMQRTTWSIVIKPVERNVLDDPIGHFPPPEVAVSSSVVS
jgi:hypothetical protein